MMPTWVSVTLLFLGIYLGFVVWAQVSFGSYRFALRYLKGDRLQFRTAVQSVGVHAPGEVFKTTVVVRNHGPSTVNVVGGTSSCSCVAYRGLPMAIPPGGSASLPVVIRFGERAGEWRQAINYLTDSPSEPAFRVELASLVRAPMSGDAKKTR